MSDVASVSIQGQNWRITPAAPGPNEPVARSFFEQKWVMVLTGVAALSVRTTNGDVIDGIIATIPMIGVGEGCALARGRYLKQRKL
jgi:hypothetical protein